MIIEHSSLMNDFLAFWFETTVDGKVKYETDHNYLEMTWETKAKDMSGQIIASGIIHKSSGLAEEKKEEARIMNDVAKAIGSLTK